MKKGATADPGPMVRVLSITAEEGAYCLYEYEIPKGMLVKHSKKISRSEPDVFAILNTHLTKKAREILEI